MGIDHVSDPPRHIDPEFDKLVIAGSHVDKWAAEAVSQLMKQVSALMASERGMVIRGLK